MKYSSEKVTYRQAEKDRDGEVKIKNRKIHAALPTIRNTAECGINNIDCDKDQYSNVTSITYTNSKYKGDNIIGDNEIDNSHNSIGSNNDYDNGHNNSDHNGMTIADNNSDNIVCNSNNDNDNVNDI